MNPNTFPHDMPNVCFADEESRQNLLDHLEDLQPEGFRPMLVIAGPPGCGKTRLGLWLMKHFGGDFVSLVFTDGRELELLLPSICEHGYVLFDDIHLDRESSRVLGSFITCKRWSYRELGTREIKSCKVDASIVATCCELSLSPQMKRRVRPVRLLLNSPH